MCVCILYIYIYVLLLNLFITQSLHIYPFIRLSHQKRFTTFKTSLAVRMRIPQQLQSSIQNGVTSRRRDAETSTTPQIDELLFSGVHTEPCPSSTPRSRSVTRVSRTRGTRTWRGRSGPSRWTRPGTSWASTSSVGLGSEPTPGCRH